ncbi:MAG: STAS domain-containing protein [Gaiellaceae bacterium]
MVDTGGLGGGDSDGLREDPVKVVERVGDAVVVRLAGELDLYNAAAVRAVLLDSVRSGPKRLVVDLSEVRFLDSTTLGVLLETRSSLGSGGAFMLAAPGLETRRTLEISGLDRHFAVHDSVGEALATKL